jgi:hypothetical protein
MSGISRFVKDYFMKFLILFLIPILVGCKQYVHHCSTSEELDREVKLANEIIDRGIKFVSNQMAYEELVDNANKQATYTACPLKNLEAE